MALVLAVSGFPSVPRADAASIGVPLFGPALRIVQSLEQQLSALSSTVAAFAQSFTTNNLTFTHGQGNEVDVQTLCIGSTCIDEAQFQTLLAEEGASTVQANAAVFDATTTNATTTIIESPILQINGDNPAIVQVGNTYNDLGAMITGPQSDLNLGIMTYVNGNRMNSVQIDTSVATTDAIDYVATDQTGLTSTSTRTVIIEASPSVTPATDALTADSTSTAQ